jgi:transcriptional regulator with PAS, ATPase and Fis domain
MLQPFCLEVIEGEGAGQKHTFPKDRVVVGTHRSADLRLEDSTISRFHCEVRIQDERIWVEDLGSRNGTFVENVLVQSASLSPGQTLLLGRTRLRLSLQAERVAVPTSSRTRFGRLVGGSVPMLQVFAWLEKAVSSDATMLVLGETGTGKEAVAEAVHQESARREGPFIVVDCSALPEALLESELFGHEKGAFTGADKARVGAFEAANGGTLFLDEIGELALNLQPKLLRALEKLEIKRVGSNTYQRVDVRVIAATHRDLRAEVNARTFRSDLYYRLAVLEVRLPSLRDHREDLPMLVEHLLEELHLADRPEAALVRSEPFQQALRHYPWPGNVRELRNHLERALALQLVELPIDQQMLSSNPTQAPDVDKPFRVSRELYMRPWEKRYLEAMLEKHQNVSAVARAAGMDRVQFYRLLWKHGLK